ncbi:translation initiation factor eIF-2B [Haloferacaceae archaeon DSL9]
MIDETVAEIQEMQTHSSSVVAAKATEALGELLDREHSSVEEFERDLQQNAGALRRANPSHASLFQALREVEETVVGATASVDEAKSLARETIDRVVTDVETAKTRAAAFAAKTFEDGETFLTHDYSSTVLEAVETALDEDVSLTAYITEARPRYIGRRTARRFARTDGIDPHLIVDSAMGYYLERCDRVVIGMDCIVDDLLYNRIGTLPLAATANHFDVPVVVVGSSAKVTDNGFAFENEFRAPSEVMLEPAEGIALENPAYDATPISLIDELITDEGARRV